MTRRNGQVRIDPWTITALGNALNPPPRATPEDFTSANPADGREHRFVIKHVSRLEPDVRIRAVCFELRGEFFIFLDRHGNVVSTARAYGITTITKEDS